MKTFTTGQIAKLCDVAPRTVTKWIDSGHIKGRKLPGSKDRRVNEDDLVEFLIEHKFPLPEELSPTQVGVADSFMKSIQILMSDNKIDQYQFSFEHFGFPLYRVSWFSGDVRLSFAFEPKHKTIEAALQELIQKVTASCT